MCTRTTHPGGRLRIVERVADVRRLSSGGGCMCGPRFHECGCRVKLAVGSCGSTPAAAPSAVRPPATPLALSTPPALDERSVNDGILRMYEHKIDCTCALL